MICKVCQFRIGSHFTNTIEKNKFKNQYKKVVVFGGLNGLGKIIADEIVLISDDKITVSRTGRAGGKDVNTYPFDLQDYMVKLKPSDDLVGGIKIDRKSVV